MRLTAEEQEMMDGGRGEALREAIAYGIIAPSGRAKNFAVGLAEELELEL